MEDARATKKLAQRAMLAGLLALPPALAATMFEPAADAEAARADLVVESLSRPPASIRPGHAFAVRVAVRNRGRQRAPAATVRFRLSVDRRRGADDVRLRGRVRVRPLAPGTTARAATRVRAPAAAPADRFRLLACIDAAKRRRKLRGKSTCRAARRPLRVVRRVVPLRGRPSETAAARIPDAPFPAPRPRDFSFSRRAGIRMSVRELLLAFAPSTTVGAANALLRGIGGSVVGGSGTAEWVLVRLGGRRTPAGMLDLVERLEEDGRVELVAPETPLAADNATNPDPAPVAPFAWEWERTPDGGNWGLEATRAPQSWNVRDWLAVDARPGQRALRRRPFVVVFDDGFDFGHRDLRDNIQRVDLVGQRPVLGIAGHGTGVAGVVAAAHDNSLDLDGLNPQAAVLGVRVDDASGGKHTLRVFEDLEELAELHPSALVYNVSLGYPTDGCQPQKHLTWRAAGAPGPATRAARAEARALIRRHGEAFARLFARLRGNPKLLFASAGNDSDLDGTRYPYGHRERRDGAGRPLPCPDFNSDGEADEPGRVDVPARWNSPWCYASAARELDTVACVQAVRRARGFPRTNLSNGAGAKLAAPGERLAVLDAAAPGVQYPARGTSLAAPLAAGAASYLLAYWREAPGNPRGLTIPELARHIVRWARPQTEGRAPVVDLFAALTALEHRPGAPVRRNLADLDDGSALDGNARTDADDENDNGDRAEAYPRSVNRDDQRRGDGSIDMKDFRALRDATVQVLRLAGRLSEEVVVLDGSDAHFKKDLNFDGCVNDERGSLVDPRGIRGPAEPRHPVGASPSDCGRSPSESEYPRYDLNGDGALNGLETKPDDTALAAYAAPRADPGNLDPALDGCRTLGDPPGCLRDIDVLTGTWDGSSGERVNVTGDDATPADEPCGPRKGAWLPTHNLLLDRDGDGEIDYLKSADLHFAVGPEPTNDYDDLVIRVRSEIRGSPTSPFIEHWFKCFETAGPKQGKRKTAVTVPLFTRSVHVQLKLLDNGPGEDDPPLDPIDLDEQLVLRYGEDKTIVWPTP